MRNPSRSLLFDALPDYMQGRARALSLMLVLPCGYIFVGLVLQTLKKWHAPYSYLTAGVIACALYLFFSIKTNRAYVEALLSTLKERLFLPSEGLGTMNNAADPELFARLVDGVKHQDEQICLTYARMLANAFPEKAPEIIFERMQHASAPVCDQLVRLIGPQLPEELLHRLETTRERGDAHERATVLATRFEAKDPRMQAQVDPCFDSDNPRLVACGILGVFSYGLEDRRDMALKRWQALLADTRTSSIFAALHLGQKLPMPASFLPQLCGLLEHADDGIKKAALAALRHGALQADARLTALLEALARSPDHQMRVASIECYRLLPAADRERLAFAALTDRHPNVVDAALGVLEECIKDLPARLFAWLNEDCAPPRQQQQVLGYLSRQGVPRQPFEDFAARKLNDAAAMAQACARSRPKPGAVTRAGHPDENRARRALYADAGSRVAGHGKPRRQPQHPDRIHCRVEEQGQAAGRARARGVDQYRQQRAGRAAQPVTARGQRPYCGGGHGAGRGEFQERGRRA